MSLDDEIRSAERQVQLGDDSAKVKLAGLQARVLFDPAPNSAGFSPCRTWRYWLTRTWDYKLPSLCVAGLNPSTADETLDDPTIRRCISFAKAWGYGGLVMLNIFAFRATDPKVMKKAVDPIGPENDYFLQAATAGRKVLCAWGNHGAYLDRGEKVTRMLTDLGRDLVCFEITKTNQPKHPLYMKGDAQPRRFQCQR